MDLEKTIIRLNHKMRLYEIIAHHNDVVGVPTFSIQRVAYGGLEDGELISYPEEPDEIPIFDTANEAWHLPTIISMIEEYAAEEAKNDK